MNDLSQQHPEETQEQLDFRARYRMKHLRRRSLKNKARRLLWPLVWILVALFVLIVGREAYGQNPNVNIDRTGGVLVPSNGQLPVSVSNVPHVIVDSGGGASAITLINAQPATGIVTGAAVTIPGISVVGTLYVTFTSITGSPSGCTVQLINYDSLGNAVNNGGTVALTVANGTTALSVSPAANLITAAQLSGTFSCSGYPSGGTISVSYAPATATDRKVSGPDAQAASQTQGPVLFGGRYYTDGTVRTIAVGANGEQIMQLPAQPFLNVTDFNDVTAGTPVNGDMIEVQANKWARTALGTTGQVFEVVAGLGAWSSILSGNYAFTGTLSQWMNLRIVDGVTYPNTEVGVQAAINAACPANVGGAVLIPPNSTSTLSAPLALASNQIFCTIKGYGRSSAFNVNHAGNLFNVPAQDFAISDLQIAVTTASDRAAAAMFNVTNINFSASNITFRGAATINNGDIFKYTDGASEVHESNITLEGGYKWNSYLKVIGTGITVSGIYDWHTVIYGGGGTTQFADCGYIFDTLTDNGDVGDSQIASGSSKDMCIRNTGAGSPPEWIKIHNVRFECANSSFPAITITDVLNFELHHGYGATCHHFADINGGREIVIDTSNFKGLQTGIVVMNGTPTGVQLGPNILAEDVCNAANNTYDAFGITNTLNWSATGITFNDTIGNHCRYGFNISGTAGQFLVTGNPFSRGQFATYSVNNTASGNDQQITRNPGLANGMMSFSATANAVATNTTSETSIVGTGRSTKVLAAKSLLPGDTIRVSVKGFLSTDTTPQGVRLKVKLGTTVILDTLVNTLQANIASRYFEVQGVVTVRSVGASGTVLGQGVFDYFTAPTSLFTWQMANTATIVLDTTASQTIDVTATWSSASANNSITGTNVTFEVI